jgi:hypothetical protein
MVAKTISCAFDREAVWRKVRDRKAVVLDMNCWINMAEDKFPLATQVRDNLRRLVSEGLIFCPLSFGLICELYKQADDSRLRVGTLMDELSLSTSYARREEIFDWEVRRVIRRLADAGPIDLSTYELYVPVLAYLTSQFQLDFPEGFPAEHIEDFTRKVKQRMEGLTFMELLKMRGGAKGERMRDFLKKIPAPNYSHTAKRTWEAVKGDKQKIQRIEAETVFKQHIRPAIRRLPLAVRAKFLDYLSASPRDKYRGCLGELINRMPAIRNHVELMAAIAGNPTRQYKINDFFDFEVMPVPLAYASVFVAQDKGIRDILRNRTAILRSNACRYCFDLHEFGRWLKEEGLARTAKVFPADR